MSGILDIVVEEVERTNDEIKRDMPKDRGNAANSLHVEVSGGVVRSLGSSYIEYLNRGSAPWKVPENFRKLGFILDLDGWAERKGLNPYAVAYKIAHDGSRIYRGQGKGIELESKLEAMTKRIAVRIPEYISTDIRNNIKDKFKK